ncbi:MAG: hypothetical protein HQK81_00370 [Desulfovibrionaceae bacterium]|nr:hypothetical protein [Desulfovibrionaceae bacterium]MBF0512502.1 hypothetical protein [Desulfovibrionaceae bacterium]
MRLRLCAVLGFPVVCLLGVAAMSLAAQAVPVPADLTAKGVAPGASPTDMADAFKGIPYRDDGTLDEQGRYTLFERPDQIFQTPGLNCSGFVLSLSRYLLGRNIGLAQAAHDRLGDSGPDSPLGKDWDFGWDLIWNIASLAANPRILSPPGAPDAAQGNDGATQRGFALSDAAAWGAALGQMRPGTMVLGSVSKTTPGGPRHYHVVLILPARDGRVLLYHATPKTGVHRLEISHPDGLRFFIEEMQRGASKKMILLLEAALPAPRRDR